MDLPHGTPQRCVRSSWLFVAGGFIALNFTYLAMPAFSAALVKGASSYLVVLGAIIAIASAGVCFWLFLRCPPRPRVPKVVCSILFLWSLIAAVDWIWREMERLNK
jgi:hypothetical protein